MKYLAILFLFISACSSSPCVKKTVVSIEKVQYRTVTIKLDDNSLIEMGQPTVKPGDVICVTIK